jgi:type III secretory pathway component EscS
VYDYQLVIRISIPPIAFARVVGLCVSVKNTKRRRTNLEHKQRQKIAMTLVLAGVERSLRNVVGDERFSTKIPYFYRH